MIEIDNITNIFSAGVEAVSGLSFTAEPGEIVGLLGENGAGKTTTFRIISALMKPTSGRCIICGNDVQVQKLRARQQMGFLPGSEPGLYDRLTALENIMYHAGLYGMDSGDARHRALQLSSLLDMDSFLNRRSATFSRGMKQRTAIARAFIHDPSVMLLDEPAAGLDAGSVIAIHRLINESRSSGKAVILASHSVHEIKKLCDRVLILHKGVLVESGSPSSVEEKYSMDFESAFLKLMGYIN